MNIPRYEIIEELKAPKNFRDHAGATDLFIEGRKEDGDRTEGLWVASALWGVIEARKGTRLTDTDEDHGYEFGKIRTLEPATPGEAMLAIDRWIRKSSREVGHFQPLDEAGNHISLADLEEIGGEQLRLPEYDKGVSVIRAQYYSAVPIRAEFIEYN